MKTLSQHDSDVKDIRDHFMRSLQSSASGRSWALGSSHLSNTMRSAPYKNSGYQLAIGTLSGIIEIDPIKMIAHVEPRVSMDVLVKATLQYDLMPPVVPEFKGITVGGAINGAAIESSSHTYGQFNDSCLSYEVLIGDGSILQVSPTEHSDLFYALTGSYGSLGIILSVKIKLIPTAKTVSLKFNRFYEPEEAIKYVQGLCQGQGPSTPKFLEGIVFSHTHVAIVEGTDDKDLDASLPLFKMKPWGRWYYQHVKESTLKKVSSPIAFKMPIYDYLFRFDRGAFWIGSYAQYFPLLARYFLEGRLSWKGITNAFFKSTQSSHFASPGDPSTLFRMLFGFSLTSQRLYKWLHTNAEGWVENRFFVQDFYIPIHHVQTFIFYVLSEIEITPLWLCPVKATKTPQFFSPHYSPTSDELFVNVGVYGIPRKGANVPNLVKQAEQCTEKLHGRKMLYSHSYYNPNEFWNIYSQEKYRHLRQKYHAEGIWTDITGKVLQ